MLCVSLIGDTSLAASALKVTESQLRLQKQHKSNIREFSTNLVPYILHSCSTNVVNPEHFRFWQLASYLPRLMDLYLWIWSSNSIQRTRPVIAIFYTQLSSIWWPPDKNQILWQAFTRRSPYNLSDTQWLPNPFNRTYFSAAKIYI